MAAAEEVPADFPPILRNVPVQDFKNCSPDPDIGFLCKILWYWGNAAGGK